MPSVTYNEQCFLIDGRPFWLLGAAIEYCRTIPEEWERRIAAAKQAGFNTILTSCPWMIHEPRKKRYDFEGSAGVRAFVELCAEAGMKVALRLGPSVGSAMDGSGIPGWLLDTLQVPPRQANPEFLSHYSRFLRKLINELDGLAMTDDGPILLVQSEHAWTCANPEQLEKYHKELTRFIREAGFNLPVINTNDLWQEPAGTIDTWRGWDDLLVHLRQLRTVQPAAPRLVSEFICSDPVVWGDSTPKGKSASQTLMKLAEILAAGAQLIVTPFHAGTNFDFLSGRLAGRPEGFLTTSPVVDPPLGEAGARGEKYLAIKRLMTFANHFGHVFAELSADFHPIVLDPDQLETEKSSSRQTTARGTVAVVPQRGSNGRAVFVFGAGHITKTTILLDDGLRMSVHLGDQPVAWFVFDVDLWGTARLDYLNICPWAIVDRSILVAFGPEKTPALVSINESPLEAMVPSGSKPLVIEHKGITVVICNQSQIDKTYHDEKRVYVGIEGLDEHGEPVLHPDTKKYYSIGTDADVKEIKVQEDAASTKKPARSISLGTWSAARTSEHSTGESPRYASLKGPESLSECGAATGYGWYRINLTSTSAKKRLCHLPLAGDRLQMFVNGKYERHIGLGPGADRNPFELKLDKGDQSLVFLADNLGRFFEGNDFARPKGLCGHLYEIKAMTSAKPKAVTADPVDPFVLRGFISGAAKGVQSDLNQTQWSFAHSKKTPILLDIDGASCSGTFVLNGEPLAYYAGASGAGYDRLLISKETNESFKRGKNELRFAPDADQEGAVEDISKAVTLYECIENLSESAFWAFAKWEAPVATDYDKVDAASVKKLKGMPCWWKTKFKLPTRRDPRYAAWLDTNGLSKGQAYLNGHNLGRYFTATAAGKAVGPQKRLYIPEAWLKSGSANELLLFDEHGFDPMKTKIVFDETGDY